MEKVILKTLIYANIFSYPLKGYEVFKWLVSKQSTLLKMEKALNKLIKDKKIQTHNGYFFLKKNKKKVYRRLRNEKYSKSLFKRAIFFSYILKIIPWIKLIGISGGLALKDASKSDDIDFLLITQGKRLWLSRLFAIIILNLLMVRREAGIGQKNAKGKICLNTILDEDHMKQQFKDLYVAHEVLQMKVLWQRGGIYSKFLSDNEWVFHFLPNWTTTPSSPRRLASRSGRGSNEQFPTQVFNWIPASAGMTMENWAKRFQLWIMKKPEGMERIEEGALYFYPKDYRENILKTYENKVKRIKT